MQKDSENHVRLKTHQYLDSIQLDTCSISFCEQFDEKSQIWNYAKHAHSCIELIYFLKGKADVRDEDDTMALSLFELVVYPSGVFHQEFLDTRYHQTIFCLHLECTSDFVFDKIFKLKDENGTLRWLIKQIYQEYHHPGEYQSEILKDLVHLLIDMMKRISLKYQTPFVNFPEKSMQYLQEHFSEKINMSQLAEEIFASASYINRVFKRRFNMTPIFFLNSYRIEVAREILIQTNSKISSVARFVGLEDPKHFAKLFKKTTGFTPAAYRTTFTNKVDHAEKPVTPYE